MSPISCTRCGDTAGPFVPGDQPICEDCAAEAASTRDDTFAVYRAGETVEGTDIGITYIYATTPVGKIRMTREEADDLGRKLTAAAEYDRRLNEDGDR